VLRIVLIGTTDDLSVLLIALIGALITARQSLANNAARCYADRLAEREAYFKEMAFTDALTGLGNRRRLMRVLYEQVVHGPPSVLLAVDLDGFKNVNDVRGHDVGDAVLAEVGRRLRANLRPGDLAARLGGDEFAVLMWAGPDEAYRVAQRLLTVLGDAYDVDGAPVFLSASIGLAGGVSAEDVPTLLHNADLALRFAKQRGKCRVERFDAAYDQWMHRRTTLEQELRGVVEREELSLVYQPVVCLPEGRPVGVEALVRWRHPTLGQVSPAEFVPIAEEFGLIARVDRWVLHQACHQLSRWMADGHDPWLSVNISIRELHLPGYVRQVVEILRAHRVPPDRLVLEVTEHSVAVDVAEVVDRLAALRAEGIRIALDDLGAGYSSLGQLGELPVDLVKIDKHLVLEPAREPARPAAPLVQAVVTLGHQLGLEVIAEGVASQAQREIVEAAGCRLAQGELFGPPMPAEHVEALLAGLPMIPAPRPAQDVGQVDSGREMRQS
jgi:diguanylate cyclase (GGDEF)-like protein